jgi:hypothetical protein
LKNVVSCFISLCCVLLLTAGVQAQDSMRQILSAGSPGNCLGIKESDLTHPFMAKCADYAAEQWTVSPPDAHGFVRFHSKRTGPDMCLGVAAADNSTVIMASCANVKNQLWSLTAVGQPNVFTVTSLLTGPGVCLGILPSSDTRELDMNACHAYPGQKWTINL